MNQKITGKQYNEAIEVLSQSIVEEMLEQIDELDPNASEKEIRGHLRTFTLENDIAEELIDGTVRDAIRSKVQALVEEI